MSDIGKSYTSFLRNASDLHAFLTVCRFGRIGQAAEELRISQPSLSQRIRNLEDVVGRPLFLRKARGVELTEAGRQLRQELEAPMEEAARRFERFLESDRSQKVWISVDYAFAHSVLIPGMAHIRQIVGDNLDIRVIASQEPLKGEGPGADIAIHMCHKQDAAEHAQLLFCEKVSAVCSPEFASAHPALGSVEDLLNDPSILVHLRSPGGEAPWCTWDEWLTLQGVMSGPLRRHTEYNTHELVMRSVLDGEGVALAWHGLSDDLFRRGWIVPLFAESVTTERGYYVTMNRKSADLAACKVYETICGMT